MEVMTDATWPACPYLDDFIGNLNGSSPLIFESCDSSSPSVASVETESECDKEAFWSYTTCSSMPFLEMDDWLKDAPSDIISSFSPCRRDSRSLASSDTKLAPIPFASLPSTIGPIKRKEYGCATAVDLDHSVYHQGVPEDPTSDAKFDAMSPSSCSSCSWIGSECFQPLRLDSKFLLNSGEFVSEHAPNTTPNYPDLSKIMVKKPILDKAVEKLGGGKKGAHMLWQLIRLWLAQRNCPVNEQLVNDQDPASITTAEQLDKYSTLEAMAEKNLEDRVCIPAMEAVPDAEKQAMQWLFQEGYGKSETDPFKSISPCMILEDSISSFQKCDKIDHHTALPLIGSQAKVDGALFASYGPGPFSDYVSEEAHITDAWVHCQARNGLNLNPLPLEPPSLISTSVASGLSSAADGLNSRNAEQVCTSPQFNRDNMESCNHGGILKSHLGVSSAFQSEASFLNLPLKVSMNPPLRTPAATSRAARKNRMAQQRRIMTSHYARLTGSSGSSAPWSPLLSGSAYRNSSTEIRTELLGRSSLFNEGKVRNCEQNLKLLLQKELKPSDVGNLGRIVLPKKEAETHLPYLTAREGVALPMEDMKTSQIWNFRYRFWPNNKSRMYLLESTGSFVKSHCLQEGDTMLLYKDIQAGKYVIDGKNTTDSDVTDDASGKGTSHAIAGKKLKRGNSSKLLCNTSNKKSSKNEAVANARVLADTPPCIPPSEDFDSRNPLLEVDIQDFPEENAFGGQDLPHLECLPNLESVDISIDEFLDLVDDSKRA